MSGHSLIVVRPESVVSGTERYGVEVINLLPVLQEVVDVRV
jgi:predicted nuclease of restriction endonuclease-like RecB superfamily